MEQRIGFGYDVHQLAKERKLILGGVDIPSEVGLLGHSDADVLLHAICDALLGAAALGDIGNHFPDTDERYKGINSITLLEHVYHLLQEEKYSIGNIDSTIVLEKPKISPYVDEMKKKISSVLKIKIDQISIKATTSEKLGFIGSGEGAVAYAVTLIFRENK